MLAKVQLLVAEVVAFVKNNKVLVGVACAAVAVATAILKLL
jgi:hypothetical protein